MAVVPFMMKCATPDCDSIVTVVEASDYAGWSLLEDDNPPEGFPDHYWLCPKCPIEKD